MASSIKNKSPLRYPGGKTRACKVLNEIVSQYFDMSNIKNIISPFFGGGSFEFNMQHLYGLNIIANDKFKPLYHFWKTSKDSNQELCSQLYLLIDTIEKETFQEYRNSIMSVENLLEQSVMYFVINRCSFSGATLSGGFSSEASKKRFTKSSIDRVKKLNLSLFSIDNLDFSEFLDQNTSHENLIFLDPPYYLEKKSKLYGNNGDMHEHFNHEKLYTSLSTKTNWMLTYNNCDYIKNLYKDYTIIEVNWSYGMGNVQSKSKEEKAKMKESSEIVIIG